MKPDQISGPAIDLVEQPIDEFGLAADHPLPRQPRGHPFGPVDLGKRLQRSRPRGPFDLELVAHQIGRREVLRLDGPDPHPLSARLPDLAQVQTRAGRWWATELLGKLTNRSLLSILAGV